MSGLIHASIGLIQAEARRGDAPWKRTAGVSALPFVTIARQVGAEEQGLATRLAEYLTDRDAKPAWRAYDRELVEQIARDHNMSQSLIDCLEDSSYTWLQEIFQSLDFTRPSDLALTRRVMQTIRGLAQAGHAVIVGRGGVFITHLMPQAVNVYLVAPLNYRIAEYARLKNVSHDEASRRVRDIDDNRAAFYARHFPRQQFEPAAFHLTINTARVNIEQAVRLIAELVPTAK
ncbi:MAG: cytidylate kinase-like family protein [Phycisphaeraceae bacterium]|nr:cytidylate kinase-like family protein [Phycisphaeraceae bacterium]